MKMVRACHKSEKNDSNRDNEKYRDSRVIQANASQTVTLIFFTVEISKNRCSRDQFGSPVLFRVAITHGKPFYRGSFLSRNR